MTTFNLNDLNGNNDLFTVKIAGEEVQVERDANVKETLKSLLEARGIDSFTVIIDGAEIVSSTAIPKTFEDCETVEVQRNVKAGMDLGDLNGSHFTVKIAGEDVSVDKTASVKDTLKQLLEQRGIDSFTILINDREIVSASDIPATFGDCETVEVRRNVKAGK